jgi:hypothetical protein
VLARYTNAGARRSDAVGEYSRRPQSYEGRVGPLHRLRHSLAAELHAAQEAGATPEEIMDALNFVGSWIGVRRLLGLEAWRATFRPDLPTIDRVVELK